MAMAKPPIKPQSAYLSNIVNIISEVTSIDASDIGPNDTLFDSLQINPETTFKAIIAQINGEFDLRLNAVEVAEEVETVNELATLVEEEEELG